MGRIELLETEDTICMQFKKMQVAEVSRTVRARVPTQWNSSYCLQRQEDAFEAADAPCFESRVRRCGETADKIAGTSFKVMYHHKP